MRATSLALLAFLAGCGRPGETASTREDPLFTTGTDEELAALEEAALAYLETHVDADAFGEVRGYQTLRVWVDDLGLGHVHLQQRVGAVPVLGGQVIVHLDDLGVSRALTDALVRVGEIDTTALYTADEAVDLAGTTAPPDPDSAADAWVDTDPRTELWIVPRDGRTHLAWSVQLLDLHAGAPSMPRVFVDAHDGAEIWRYDNLQTTQISQNTRYDGTQTIEIFQSGSTKYLEDPVRDFVTVDFRGGSSSLYRITTTSASFSDTTEAQLHHGTAVTADYFLLEHGRLGIDGLGGPGFVTQASNGVPSITGAAHFGFRYNNAFWDGVNGIFVAGDGDNFYFSPLVSQDVVTHEFAHGVTQYTAGLIYANESGALNESMSDVFAAAAEAWVDGAVTLDVWEIGEDCWTPSTANDALRYMDDPTLDGSSYDHYDDRYVGLSDNGGVHWNSGIANLAFYLVSEGGNHPTYGDAAIAGIGIEGAADIWYRALTTYLTSYSGFEAARVATILAAEDLYGIGAPEVQVVDDAWGLVGVTPWVLLPSGWASSGVGSPSAVYRKTTGEMVMAFEVMITPPTADCPNGEWGVGLATSTDGRDFAYVGSAPILGPQGGTYHSCVVAHPTLMVDDRGDGLHLWFKAETDLATCNGDADCLYSGVGYAHVASDLSMVDTLSSAPVVTTFETMGYPSVIRSDGGYVMALQSYPDIHVATAPAPEGPWTLDPASAIAPGVTTYAPDEVFNPALVCEGDATLGAFPYSSYFGGRDTDGPFGAVLDGGVGHAISADAETWLMSTTTVQAFTGDTRWRHWSVLRHGTEPVYFYDEKVGGVNRIGVSTRLTDWTIDGFSSRTCPRPSWW